MRTSVGDTIARISAFIPIVVDAVWLLGLTCVLSIVAATAPAHAQYEQDLASDIPGLTYRPPRQTRPVRRECEPRFMAGPAVGMVLAPAGIAAGSYMVNEAVRDQLAVNRRLAAAGGVTIALSSVALIYSVGKLVTNHRRRKRNCPNR